MKTLIAYIRVSTEDQGRSGLGIEAQRKAIQTFAEQQGATIAHEFVEVQSGGDDDRPQLKKAKALLAKMVRAGDDCWICVSKLDRLSRRVSFIAREMETKTRFVTVQLGFTDDPFTLHIYAALAEKERMLISERTKAALDRLKDQGKVLGNPRPAASCAKGMATRVAKANEGKARVMLTIRDLQANGVTKLVAIADELNKRGISTPRGGAWSATQVSRVIG